MIKPGSNADIAGFAERINNLLNEKDMVSIDVREVYEEAHKQGVNTKALRKVISKRRAKTPDPAVVAAMEAYEHALDEAAMLVSKGASLRQAEKATGFSKSAIQRRRVSHRNENVGSGTAHDADGVITETAESPPNESCGGGESRPAVSPLTEPMETVAGTVGSRLQPTAGVAPGLQDPTPSLAQKLLGTFSANPWDDVGDMPAHLRRARG